MSFKNLVNLCQVLKSRKTGKTYVVINCPKDKTRCNVLELSKDLRSVVGGSDFLSDLVTIEFFETVSGKPAVNALSVAGLYLEKHAVRYGQLIVSRFIEKAGLVITQWGTKKTWFKQCYAEKRMNKQSAFSAIRALLATCYRLPRKTENFFSIVFHYAKNGKIQLDHFNFMIDTKKRTVSVCGRETKLFNY